MQKEFTSKSFPRDPIYGDWGGISRPGLEVMTNYGSGLILDSSILPFIPRPALWLDRLSQGLKMTACLSSLRASSDLRMVPGPHLELKPQLHLAIDISMGGRVVARLVGDWSAYARCNGVFNNPPNLLQIVWFGGDFCSVKFSPAAGHMDKFFKLENKSVTGFSETLSYLNSEVERLNHKAVAQWKSEIGIGQAYAAYEDAWDKIIQTYAYYEFGGRPPELTIYDRLRTPVGLLTPDRVRDGVLEGVRPQALIDQLNKQVQRLRNDSRSLAASSIATQPTPVDMYLSTVNLYQQRIEKMVQVANADRR